MNKCFVIGYITDEIDFKFILNGKHISIVSFSVKLSNNSIIQVIAYNETADFCYSHLKKEDIVLIEGRLNFTMDIIINRITKLKGNNVMYFKRGDYGKNKGGIKNGK